MNTSKIIRGPIGIGPYTRTAPITQWDYGYRFIPDIDDLPATYRIDFANNKERGEALSVYGDETGAEVPEELIATGKDVFAFYVHIEEGFARTAHTWMIPNHLRAKADREPTPSQQDSIDQLIVRSNAAVAGAEQSASGAAESAQAAANSAGVAAQSASKAAESAQTASAKAIEAAQIVEGVEGYAESAAASASQAQTSAQTASTKASEASASASTASAKATEATTAAGTATTAKNDAVSAKTAAQTAQAAAETAQEAAEDAAESVSASAAQIATNTADITVVKENLSEVEDVLNDKAPIIIETASGSIASFSDGADNMPMKSLIVDIDPVQDLHGQDAPYPAGGGKNLLDYSSASLGTTTTSFANGINLTANQAYTFSYYGNENVNIICYLHGESTRLFTSGYTKSYTYTPTEDTIVDISYYNSPSIVSAENLFQLEKGAIKTAYAPYSNICPISGWTGCEVNVSPTTDAQDGNTYPIDWQTEAGTVYGGTIDIVSGVLTVDRAYALLNDPNKWITGSGTVEYMYNQSFLAGDVVRKVYANSYIGLTCSYVRVDSAYQATQTGRWTGATSPFFGIRWTDSTLTLEQIKADAEAGKISIIFELAEPITYQLTPQEVKSLLGENHVWADTGDCSVEYKADTKLYIEKLTQPTEDDMIADANIVSGQYFMVGNSLYLATANIANGTSIIVGTNCTRKSLSEALNEINA